MKLILEPSDFETDTAERLQDPTYGWTIIVQRRADGASPFATLRYRGGSQVVPDVDVEFSTGEDDTPRGRGFLGRKAA